MGKSYLIGVDVGGLSVKTGLVTMEGELVAKWSVPTRLEGSGSLILPDTAASVREELGKRNIPLSEIHGIGVGVPGQVKEMRTAFACFNLLWGETPVADILSGLLDGVPVRVENDANLAALGEAWQGSGRGRKSLAMITLGTGVGCGLISNGMVHSGAHGAAGEFGHTHARDGETEVCNCGRRGCLEQYASAVGIARLAQRALLASDKPSSLRALAPGIETYVRSAPQSSEEAVLDANALIRHFPELNAKAVLDAWKAGDALATEITEEFAQLLGEALSQLAIVFDPECFVIGGGVSAAGEPLLRILHEYYEAATLPLLRDTPFILAALGNDAGIYGAARLGI